MSIRLCLLVDESCAGQFRRLSKTQREVRSIITQQILPGIGSSILDKYLPEHYPWCFAISAASLRQRHSCVGAFMVLPDKQGKKLLVVVYSPVSYSWLKKNMHVEFPLTFWASRILNMAPKNDLVKKDWQLLWQWVKALGRSYSPWRERVLTSAWQFKNQSQMLLREGSQEDYCIRNNDGVEIMPWKNWPDCIQQDAGVWIWRQSRHGKILDSRKISLRRAEAKLPEASF